MNKTLTEQQKSWLLLVALWLGLLLLASLRPIAVPDEGRYGEIGRWMLVSGDWLTPRLNGIPFFHKPPYLYWLEALSVALFGVHELALRLIPALHAGLMLSALYLAARHISGEAIARRASLMLGTSLSFLVGGQYINHDMLVATWIGLAIWCFAFAFMAGEKPHQGLARLGFLACALGMLSKGLIGIALPGLVILLWLMATRQLKKIIYLPWLSGLGLFSTVALPWFVLAQQKYPDFFNYMFVGQQFNRYTAAVYNNPQPWWFYVLALGLLLFPWMFFALAQWRRVSPTDAQNPLASMPATWWKLCWIWLLTILLFFSIPHSKLVGYILPVMPPLTLLAATGWQRWVSPHRHAARWFAGVCVCNSLLALILMLKVGDVTRASRAEDLAQAFACAAKPEDTLFVSDAFPYDLPLYAQTTKPMVVLGDWTNIRKNVGDGWQRELFEGADFDSQAAQALQPTEKLGQLATTPGYWFASRSGNQLAQNSPGWTLYFKGAGWDLFRSGGTGDSAPKSPEATQYKGLPGCKQQR